MALHKEEDHKVRILAIANTLQSELDLGWLTINHKFNSRTDGESKTAESVVDWQYRQATVIWNLAFAITCTDEEIRNTAIHEFVHILIAPLWDSIPRPMKHEDHFEALNEFSTENVTRAIAAALQSKAW